MIGRRRALHRCASLGLAVFFTLAGCTRRPVRAPSGSTASSLVDDSAHPARAQGWVDTRLYFGLGPADHPEQGISESAWRRFLDREVTPRFPDGLTVLDAYGQWLSKT